VLSYKHGFHAGNFADVHKHMIQIGFIDALNRKAKPWSYLETHGGRAFYDLSDEQAQKTNEFKEGVAALWGLNVQSTLLKRYLEQVKAANNSNELSFYPGSPSIAANMARGDDRISVMELHNNEYEWIRDYFAGEPAVSIHHRDGYEGVISLLPPKPHRGAVLIDPSYEVKTEYIDVARFLAKALKRWEIGQYMIWYPVLPAKLHEEMVRKVVASGVRRVFKSEFYAKHPDSGRMYGSGMLLINPPWQLDELIIEATRELHKRITSPTAPKPVNQWLVGE
jgi:23S rRNA (adenine2030-N6)-methyltransferase